MGCACGKGVFRPQLRAPPAVYEALPSEDPSLKAAPAASASSSVPPQKLQNASSERSGASTGREGGAGAVASGASVDTHGSERGAAPTWQQPAPAAMEVEAPSQSIFGHAPFAEAAATLSERLRPSSQRVFAKQASGDKLTVPAPDNFDKVSNASVDSQGRKVSRSSDTQRAMEYIAALRNMPPNGPVMRGITWFLKYGITPLLYVASLYVWVGQRFYDVYKMLPVNVVEMLFGVALCFFGGVYFAAIAAIEAARVFGGADLWEHLQTCWDEGSRVRAASLADDKERTGVADMSGTELVQHKAKVAMMAVKDPDRLQGAVVALMNVYLAVIATLKFQFARTVAIALGIASMLTLPMTRFVGPLLATVMGPDLNHWVPCVIDTTVKLIAVFVASYIQAVISAFYSALRGGRLFAHGLFNAASGRGWMDHMPDCITAKPFDPDRSYLDEAIAYPLAAAGFYVQLTSGFSVAFPWNILLLPLSLVEWFLRWQVYT